MIVVDTHVWIWWVHQDDRLMPQAKDFIVQHESRRIGVSATSCWEVATARTHGSQLVTMDRRILAYPHVNVARFA